MNYTKNFNQLSKDDAHIAGGKGASLGEMLQNNIPVPDGYVVTADTFDHFLEETGLTQKVTSILSTVNTNDIHTSEIASKQIQKLIKDANIPEDIEKEIMSSFKKLDTTYVAVRSSATAEDGADHAWAGQLSSYLNTTDENLLEMVQNCWASLFTPRAIFYRFEKKLHNTHISVAVVVQKMVNSEKSGIAFSVHPVTEDHNQIIIEAGLGLGEAIVSGSVTPDSYVVTKEPQSVIDININTQNKALYRSDTLDDEHGFNEWKNLSKKQANEQVLNEEQIKELSNIIITVENHYGFPCDIEWAFENDKFYIVQSRPITTLKNKNKKDSVEVDADNGVVKVLEKAETKIHNNDLLFDNFIRYAKENGYINQKGNMSILLLGNICNTIQPSFVSKYEYNNIEPVITLQKEKEAVCFFDLEMYRDFSRISYYRIGNSIYDLPEYKDYKKITTVIDGEYKDFQVPKDVQDQKKLAKKLLSFVKELLACTLFSEAMDHELVYELAEKEGVEDIDTFVDIVTLATKPSFDVYHKELILDNKDIEWTFTDYYSAPEKKERVLLSEKVLQDFSVESLKQEIENTKKEIFQNTEKVKALLDKSTSQQKKLIEFIQESINVRDERKEYLLKAYTLLSDLFRSLAKFYGISYGEISTLSEYEIEKLDNDSFRGKLKDRFDNGVALVSKSDGADIFHVNYESVIDLMLDGDFSHQTEINGICANKGHIKGVVRVVVSRKDFESFKENEVLVTGMTRAEYVPIMKKASAIITDEGGVTCHAAIISREIGKPCIIGTRDATQILKDGDFVEVDADNGVVKVLKKNSENKDSEKSIKDHRSEFFSYITKVKWNKNWAGEYSLIECCSYGLGYLKLLEKKWGIGLNSVLFSFKNGRSENYIVKKEVDILSKHVAKKLNNEEALINYIDDYESTTHNCLKYLEKHHIIKNFDDYSALIQIMNQFLVLNFPVKRFVDYLDLELSKKFLGIFGKIRVLGEPIYEKVQKMVTQYMKNISNQFEIESHLVSTLTLKELEALIVHNKKVSQKELEKRYKQCFLFINKNSNEVLFSQKEADEVSQYLLNKGKQENTLFGQTAYKGKVKGKVKVIRNPKTVNLKNIKRPFILVTGMTRPEFLPFFEKSIAVVTDAGGVLSHAAITARELKKPCIIGTEFATQILKDGDFVEVDADNGVVKVLKKTN